MQYYKLYFQLVDFALKAQDSTVVVSSSTFPESRYTGYQAEDFMRRYMWPNSCLPSATALISAAHAGSQGRFTVEAVENHAARAYLLDPLSCAYLICHLPPSDYPRTLREWGRRLEANLTQELVAKDYPALKDPAEFAAFKRKWQYLFAYAGAGFAHGYITCHLLTFIREVCLAPTPTLANILLTHRPTERCPRGLRLNYHRSSSTTKEPILVASD